MTDGEAVPLPPLPTRPRGAHKGQCGRVLVVAGSPGMTGAGCLCCRAALRSGAGVVLWAIPRGVNPTCETLCVEAMTLPLPETQGGALAMAARESIVEAAREADCVVLGPGMPVAGETGELMRLLIPEIYPTLVLDGGALSAMGDDFMILKKRQGATILTPHPGEMGRLIKKTSAQVQEDRKGLAMKYAKFTGAIVALKGEDTIVTDGQSFHVNTTGNPGMATAGAGDVLCGVVAALIGQGLAPLDAARLGVHLHGRAGDLAMVRKGVHGLVSSDIVENLPDAFLQYAAHGGGN